MGNVVFLDQATLPGVDLSALEQLGLPFVGYAQTPPHLVVERLKQAHIVLVNKVRLQQTELQQLPQLKLICVTATGINNIDIAYAKSVGIAVCHARDYALNAVPQHCMALLLALSNQVINNMQACRQGEWSRSPDFCLLKHPIRSLAGLKFGVIGYGGLGQATARLAEAFGMEILIAERPGVTSTRPGRLMFEQVLADADVISLHCPATPENYHLMNKARLQLCKSNALLLNTARGSLIDPVALIEALSTGKLAGAALDVLDTEPPPADHPLLAASIPNLILSPHVAWASPAAMQQLILQTVENIQHFLSGQTLRRCDLEAPSL